MRVCLCLNLVCLGGTRGVLGAEYQEAHALGRSVLCIQSLCSCHVSCSLMACWYDCMFSSHHDDGRPGFVRTTFCVDNDIRPGFVHTTFCAERRHPQRLLTYVEAKIFSGDTFSVSNVVTTPSVSIQSSCSGGLSQCECGQSTCDMAGCHAGDLIHEVFPPAT